jgi:hypothetical protein
MLRWLICSFLLAVGSLTFAIDRESVTFENLDSDGTVNAPTNGVGTYTATGGYGLGIVRVDGWVQKVHADTKAYELRIRVKHPDGTSQALFPFTFKMFDRVYYAGAFSIRAGANPAGEWEFRCYESEDNAGGVDARWTSLTVTFTDNQVPPSEDLGTLSSGMREVNFNCAAGQVKWYRFRLPASCDAARFLDIDTEGTTTFGATNDTALALFVMDREGLLIATDDDSGTGLRSQLTFGAPVDPRAAAGVGGSSYDGRHGNLRRGPIYLLAVAGSSLNVSNIWNVATTSTATGNIRVRLRLGVQDVGFTYIDSVNPTGLPDISQKNEPICASAAAANGLWEWSDHSPFNSMSDPLFWHRDRNNFAVNWGEDSNSLVQGLATKIYGPLIDGTRSGGLGLAPAIQRHAFNTNQAYHATKHPNGLGVEVLLDAKATYSRVDGLIGSGTRNAVLSISWYLANGEPLKDGGGLEFLHAVTLVGMDRTRRIVGISNPWGDHATAGDPNLPVSTTYYDKYTLDAQEATTNDRAVLARDGAGNSTFVSSFDRPGATAAYIQVVRIFELKRGPCPTVMGEVSGGGPQTLSYVASNPDEPEPMYHVYLFFDDSSLSMSSLAASAQAWLALNLPAWSVQVLDPNAGPEKELFATPIARDPSQEPDYWIEDWQNGLRGLHFYTTTDPLTIGTSRQFMFSSMTVLPPHAWNGVYAVANADRDHAFFGMTGVGIQALSGNITLQDHDDPTRVPIDVEIRAPGTFTVLQQMYVGVDAAGNFAFPLTVAPGVYDISFKASHWLRRTVYGHPWGVPIVVSLINGDVDGDNEVMIGDYALLSAAFGSWPGDPNWNPEADLNGDESVDIGDYAILSSNFGSWGDE